MRSSSPSPLKSPLETFIQGVEGFQRSAAAPAQKASPKVVPVERPTRQRPVVISRPAMSSWPSPLKSPTWKST